MAKSTLAYQIIVGMKNRQKKEGKQRMGSTYKGH